MFAGFYARQALSCSMIKKEKKRIILFSKK